MDEGKPDNQFTLFATAGILILGTLMLPLTATMSPSPARLGIISGVIFLQVILAGANFMHLRHERRSLWAVILPTFILGGVLLFALMPDTILEWAK
ncbi:MAG: hypothetical protein EXR99_16160 [Gemmataceae bacterium]|nr:hypothetical protein [Gemmataceae bacterium]